MADIDSLESSIGAENGVVVRLEMVDSGPLPMARLTRRKACLRLVHRGQPVPAAKLPRASR